MLKTRMARVRNGDWYTELRPPADVPQPVPIRRPDDHFFVLHLKDSWGSTVAIAELEVTVAHELEAARKFIEYMRDEITEHVAGTNGVGLLKAYDEAKIAGSPCAMHGSDVDPACPECYQKHRARMQLPGDTVRIRRPLSFEPLRLAPNKGDDMTGPLEEAVKRLMESRNELVHEAIVAWAQQASMTPEEWLKHWTPIVKITGEGRALRLVVEAAASSDGTDWKPAVPAVGERR